MKIAFLSNKLTLRGTEVNLYHYADYNEKILHNESIIITRPYDHVIHISPRDLSRDAYKKFHDRFPVEYYYNPWDISEIVKREKIDAIFIEKAGSTDDGLVFDCCKTIIHAVFTTEHPHGDLYAPISDMLNYSNKTNFPVLPNIVDVYDTNENLRRVLGIPEDALVFGSYSGADEYTVDYVKQAICDVVNNTSMNNIYFIYLNIDKFGPESPRLKFLPGTHDMKYKRMFINTCDAMLYARKNGETFGLSCGEFLVSGKQVIGKTGEEANAHEMMLGDNMVKHSNYSEVFDIITNWKKYKKPIVNCGYHTYKPIEVMRTFKYNLERLFQT
jgi:hypothetical protein